MSTKTQLGSNALKDFCAEMGIGGLVRRVIIDMPYNDVVKIYVEKLAESEKFEIALNLLKNSSYQIVSQSGTDERSDG